MKRGIILLLACIGLSHADTPRVRPASWAQPMIGLSLGNCYKVSDDLYRSEQPGSEDVANLKALGIKTVISLRHYHRDPLVMEGADIKTIQYPMDAGSVTAAQLKDVLALIRDSKKPVLVHCWHGSDRTGFVVAGYRVGFMNWPVEAAIDEFKNGGFGYHASAYPNIEALLRNLNWSDVRKTLAPTHAIGIRRAR